MHYVAICFSLASLLPLAPSFDASASDRGGWGVGGSADEGQDGGLSLFRFQPQSPAAASRLIPSTESKNAGPELENTYRVAFGHLGVSGGVEELQQDQVGTQDDDVPFEVIGGW